MLCHAPEARCLRTTRRAWTASLRCDGLIYLIVSAASAAAAAIGVVTLFDDEAPALHATQQVPAATAAVVATAKEPR